MYKHVSVCLPSQRLIICLMQLGAVAVSPSAWPGQKTAAKLLHQQVSEVTQLTTSCSSEMEGIHLFKAVPWTLFHFHSQITTALLHKGILIYSYGVGTILACIHFQPGDLLFQDKLCSSLAPRADPGNQPNWADCSWGLEPERQMCAGSCPWTAYGFGLVSGMWTDSDWETAPVSSTLVSFGAVSFHFSLHEKDISAVIFSYWNNPLNLIVRLNACCNFDK